MQVICIDFYGKSHAVDSKDLVDRISAYGIYVVRGNVLLIQDPRSGRWELPGGGIEKGETIRRGLVREFIEETGITPTGIFTLLTEWTENYFDVPTKKAWRSKRKFYLIKNISHTDTLLTSGNNDDSATAKFIPITQIKKLQITTQVREAIQAANQLARL